MKIQFEQSKILPSLNLVSSVVEKRQGQALPILSNLYFRVENGNLNLVGSDLEIEVSETLNKVEADDGKFTVSTRKIFDICRMLPEGASIVLKQDDDKITLTSGRSRYTLKTLPADDYPRLEIDKWEERFKIKATHLKSVIEKTHFSMAQQDVRYYLNGLLLELSTNNLKAVATDGHRLSQTDIDIDLTLEETRQLIIPRKAVIEIRRFLGCTDLDATDLDNATMATPESAAADNSADATADAAASAADATADDTEVTLEMNSNHLKLTKDESILITKLIDGKFPEFKAVLETELPHVVNVNRAAFIDAMTRAGVLATDDYKGVKIVFEQGIMRITAKNLEHEEAVEEIEVDFDGDKLETGYNGSYLVEAARAITNKSVELHLQGEDGLCVLKQPEDTRSTWLVMPMRI